MLFWILATLGLSCAAAGIFGTISSWRECERRATGIIAATTVVCVLVIAVLALYPTPLTRILGWSLLGLITAGVIVVLIPDRSESLPARLHRSTRFDERDTMFSRRELQADSQQHAAYYDRNPDALAPDKKWRVKPGLMAADSRYADRVAFAATAGSFDAVEELHGLVDGEPAPNPHRMSGTHATNFVTSWARKLGALDAGVAELKPEHIYSVGGRRERYDNPIELNHEYAIAFTVEMDHEFMKTAPTAPTLMESAQQYFNAGAIAVQLAIAIRALGYEARAHIDANYQVICPLIARDAGLGEIGRMGLLMTPSHGPRVRIGVVTTNLPLELLPSSGDPTVEDFCRLCEKCAVVCPSQAIAYGDRDAQTGVDHWKVDAEACFSYWCEAGTDCGRCVIACPYSHQDTALHRVVRKGIRRSPVLRRLAVVLDDTLYGKRVRARATPEWLQS